MAASDAFVVAVDAEVAADFCDAAAFVSDVFAAAALVAAALFEDSAAAALFAASLAFVDAVPALEDAD
ncbi:phage tail protein [Escherichia coli]|nr:phage tail protein [Escherichia coli]